MIDMVFNIANIICLIGTLLMINAVVKNRDILRGYSLLGSLLTLIAVSIFELGFYLMGNYLSFSIGTVTVAFWALVVIYNIIYR